MQGFTNIVTVDGVRFQGHGTWAEAIGATNLSALVNLNIPANALIEVSFDYIGTFAENWAAIILEARQKEVGIELTYISEIMCSMPQKEFESVAWVNKPEWNVFQQDIKRIAYDMINA